MIVLTYGNKDFNILDEFTINSSSREVTFNDLNVDFTGYTINDLPIKYQEVQVVDKQNGKIAKNYFTGYILNYRLQELHNTWEDRTLTLSLVSPYALTTLRTTSLIGTNTLEEALNLICSPLIYDGFEIKECNVAKKNITSGYMLETIENCLNDLSNKYNFWWYIDENKNIYFYDLDYLFSKDITNRYSLKKLPVKLESITPSMDATDYCNIVNIRNVRAYFESNIGGFYGDDINDLLNDVKLDLKKGDVIDFNFPFDIAYKNIEKILKEKKEDLDRRVVFRFYIKDNEGLPLLDAKIVIKNEQLEFENIGFDGNQNATEPILFKRDTFFQSLITGFVYNGEQPLNGQIAILYTVSGLKWTKVKFINNAEIEKCRGVISKSGRIEKIVDLASSWKTQAEIKEIAMSYLKLNQSQTDEITLALTQKPDFKIGDIIKFDLDNFYVNNEYIVTDISWNYRNDEDQEYIVSVRNKNYLANFIDVFRANEIENDDVKDTNLVTVNYVNEEIKEKYEVE